MISRAALAAALVAAALARPAAPQTAATAEAFARHDFAAAAERWRAEAGAGSTEAKFGLGLVNDLGLGMPRDAAKALRWYLEAAEEGLPQAQFNVGVMLDAGTGAGPAYPSTALSRDGHTLLTTQEDGAVSVVETGTLTRRSVRIRVGRSPVYSPAFGPGGTLVVAGFDGTLAVVDPRTGRQIATQAAERLIGVSLELGGKNPMLVLADADVEAAVDGAVRGSFVGAGQVCVSIERLYVHESLYARFADRLVERMGAMKLSASLDYDGDMGSLTSTRQIETVDAHVRDAVSKGATLLAGGRRRPGCPARAPRRR